jgi:hypothetical protein
MSPLLFTLALAVAFIFTTGAQLPPEVASHFVAGGTANAFMPRDVYLRFMTALVVVLPLLFAVLSSVTAKLPVRYINLPNREYWLAPERQADTLAYLRRHGTRFGIVLAVFLCFVHWLVVLANAHSPARFPEPLFFAGITVFLIALAIWLGTFVVHFRRRPHT